MSPVEQGDIFGPRWFPLCATCGEPERVPHRHLTSEAGAIAEMLLAEMARRQPVRHLVERAAPLVSAPEYLTIKQLAAYSGWSVRTIREWTKDPADPLPSFRPGGGKAMFRKKEFDEWLSRRRAREERGVSVSGIVDDVLRQIGRR